MNGCSPLVDNSPGKDMFGWNGETYIIIASCPGNWHNHFKGCSGKNVIFCPVNFDTETHPGEAKRWYPRWDQNIQEAVKACRNKKFAYVEPRVQTVLWSDAPGGGHDNIRVVAIDDGDPSHYYCGMEREHLKHNHRLQGVPIVVMSPQDLHNHLVRWPEARRCAALQL